MLNNAKKNSEGFIETLKVFVGHQNPIQINEEEAAIVIRNVATLLESYIRQFYVHHSFSQNANRVTELFNCIKYIMASDIHYSQLILIHQMLMDIHLDRFDRVGYIMAGIGRQCVLNHPAHHTPKWGWSVIMSD